MNLQNQIDYLKGVLSVDMFAGCTVPAPLDMDRVRGAIVMRCGLLTPLYNEPETQQAATQQFFFENQWNFEHIVKVLEAEYSPIENVFEVRDETTKNTGADTLTIAKNSQETISSNGSSTGTTENTISAENVSSYSPDRRSTDSENTENFEVRASGGSDTHTNAKNSQSSLNVKRHGNIGVTTNQDMINQELDLLNRFNPYRFIADLYEKELTLGIY